MSWRLRLWFQMINQTLFASQSGVCVVLEEASCFTCHLLHC